VVLLCSWHAAVTGRTWPAPPFRSAGPRPGDSFPKTRTQDIPAPSVSRSGCVRGSRNVVKPRIQGVLAPWRAGFRASGLPMHEDRGYVMSRGADSFKRGEKLSFANAVKPYDTRDGDGDVCLELRTSRSPQWLRQARAIDIT